MPIYFSWFITALLFGKWWCEQSQPTATWAPFILRGMGIFQQPSRTSADIDRKIAFPLRSSNVEKTIKFLAFVFLLLSSSFFWLLAFRFVSLPFLIASWVLFVKVGVKDLRLSLATWGVWLALTFSPIDVFPIPKGGSPRLVPLVMGLPRPETVARAKRGEVILGGCMVSGFEPTYYLVW